MRKSTKIIKRLLALFLVVLMSINSFAAIVSDNDGSAFVTKAEFEALKTNFAEQIDSYNDSIDRKIDGAIAAYLSGIKIDTKTTVQTGFDYEGGDSKTIKILGRSDSGYNFANEFYTRDLIYVVAIGTYRSSACFYEQDAYDNWVFKSSLTNGDTDNTYILLNADNTVKKIYKDVKMDCQRCAWFYSATHQSNGITWTNIKLFLVHPTLMFSNNRAFTDDTLQEIYGYGHQRSNTTSNTEYPNNTNHWVWTAGSTTGNAGTLVTGGDTLLLTDMHPQHAMYDNQLARIPTWIKNQTSILITGDEQKDFGLHFSYNGTLALRASKENWNEIGMVKQLNTNRVDYNTTAIISYEGGYWAYWASSIAGSRAVAGYGLKFDQIVDSSGASEVNPNKIYYANIKKYWNKDIKYNGGFPVYFAENEGEIDFKLKSDTAKTIIFTDNQQDSMPTISDSHTLQFDYKLSTDSTFTTDVKSLDMVANSTYEFKIKLEKNQVAYANIDVGSGIVTLTKVDDAIFTS